LRPFGSGHFVKTVHNGTNTVLMQSYATVLTFCATPDSKDSGTKRRYDMNPGTFAEGLAGAAEWLDRGGWNRRRGDGEAPTFAH